MTPTEHFIDGLALITQLTLYDLFIFFNDPLERKYLLVHHVYGGGDTGGGTHFYYYLPWEHYRSGMSMAERRLYLRLLCVSADDAETVRSLQVFKAGHLRRSSPAIPFLL